MNTKLSPHTSHIDDHDEGYFASFTDLLVGILFIFIIMLMMFATNYQQKQQHTEDVTKVLTKINEARNQILVEMQKSLKNDGVQVSIDLENGVLRLPESLLFESGKWEPNQRGNEALNKLADVLMTYLPCLARADQSLKSTCQKMNLINEPMLETVLIEGHTDNKPFGTEKGFDSNWGLSAKRSITIFNRLTSFRPELDKNILNANNFPILGVSAYAARRPVSQSNLEQNRRIDLRFIMRSPTPEDIERIKKEMKSG
jgi:chemotaxis protein MotB